MKVFKAINTFIEYIEKLILSLGMLSLAVITVGNAISRRAFNRSWSFGEEASLFILVIVTFMGISYAARKGRHIRMTAFFDQLGVKQQRFLMIFITLITSAVLFYLAYHSYNFTLRMHSLGRVTSALQVPYYLVVMWVPIGLGLGGLQYFFAMIRNIIEKEAWLSFDTKTDYIDPEDMKTANL